MRVEQEQVQQFHAQLGYEIGQTGPDLVAFELAMRRFWLMSSEVNEYMEAAAAGDLVKVADAIGDILYTVLGTAVVHGIDAQAVFAEVHRSNMTKSKLDPVTRKGGKGEGFEPPNIAAVLLRKKTGLDKL